MLHTSVELFSRYPDPEAGKHGKLRTGLLLMVLTSVVTVIVAAGFIAAKVLG